MSSWSKLAGLSRWQWRVLALAPFVLLLTWFRLRAGGYQKALAAAQSAGCSGLSAEKQLALARETAYALAVAVKYGPWRPRCLLRSLALGWFLGKRGIPFRLRLAVPAGESPAAFSAHAWLEHDGEVLNDREDIARRFAPFDA